MNDCARASQYRGGWDRFVALTDGCLPSLKYLSLACYSAWILLMMTGSGATSHIDVQGVGSPGELLYKYSGVALSLCLCAAGLAGDRIAPLLEKRWVVLVAGALASASTFVVCGGGGIVVDPWMYALASAGTGVGTALVCLRVGCLYSTLNGAKCFFTAVASGLLSNLFYFMCVALPIEAAVVVLSLLPFVAAALGLIQRNEDAESLSRDAISIDTLPRGYFLRFTIMIALFAIAIGIMKGLVVLLQPVETVASQSLIVVFASFALVLAIAVGVALRLSVRAFDVSKIYYPTIIGACLGALVVLVLGGGFGAVQGIVVNTIYNVFAIIVWMLLSELSSRTSLSPMGALVVLVLGGGFGAVQGIVVNTIYNVFAIIVWMLLSELSSRTSLSPIKVFGLGRGMSAIGTTLGWYVASGAASSAEDTTLFFSVLFVLMLVVILAVVVLVFDERTISLALEKAIKDKEKAAGASGPDPSGVPSERVCDTPASATLLVFDERTISLALEKAIKDKEKAAGASGPDPSGVPSERVCDTPASATWEEACEAVSSRFGLTARESEVAALLGRGRTVGYVADELGISHNTVKGYIKNVYAKCDVFGLTARESEVAALLGRGRTVGYVADELGISHNTVKGYIKNVYAKCDVHSRQDLIDLIESFL